MGTFATKEQEDAYLKTHPLCSTLNDFPKDTDCEGKPIAKVKGTEQDPLELADLPDDLKKKIGEKAVELALKYPHMKRDRVVRKAGEFYKVKFMFE